MKPYANKFSCTEVSPFWRNLEGYFNVQEKDDEIYGKRKSLSFEFRNYDSRIGRFWSVDSLVGSYPWNSPYAFAENRVIDGIDLGALLPLSLDVVKYISSFNYYIAKKNNTSYTWRETTGAKRSRYKLANNGDLRISQTLHGLELNPDIDHVAEGYTMHGELWNILFPVGGKREYSWKVEGLFIPNYRNIMQTF